MLACDVCFVLLCLMAHEHDDIPSGTVTEAHIARKHTRTHDILPHPANNIYQCFKFYSSVILVRKNECSLMMTRNVSKHGGVTNE
jgi:hypothetical protein